MDPQERPDHPSRRERHLPPLRFPGLHGALLLVSSLDVILTWLVLERGGREINPVAALVISAWGLPGAVAFKFSLVLFIIIAVEVVARQRLRLARALSITAAAVSTIPVVYSLVLLALHAMQPR
jgi:hypothetical protein